jgi:hypothetical protein
MGFDEFDYDYGVEVEWVTDEDIPDWRLKWLFKTDV